MADNCKQLLTTARTDLNVRIDNTGPWLDKIQKTNEKHDTMGLHVDFMF